MTNVTVPISQKTICGSTWTVNIEQCWCGGRCRGNHWQWVFSGKQFWKDKHLQGVPCAVSIGGIGGGHIVGRQIKFAPNVAFAVIWLSLCPYFTFYTFATARTNYPSRQTFVLKTSKVCILYFAVSRVYILHPPVLDNPRQRARSHTFHLEAHTCFQVQP